jgi:hypothetical protein
MAKENNQTERTNGWAENKQLVLHRLKEIEYEARSIEKRVCRLEKDMAIHASQTRVVAGVIGAITGLIPALLSIWMASRM